MNNFTFKTREEYFAYRAEWKIRYAEAVKEIQQLRRARKEFLWQYRPKELNTIKRKTKIGPNPNYNPSAQWRIQYAKQKVTELLNERMWSKIEAGKQRQKRLDKEKPQVVAM